jgi:hypothetical protein
MALLIGMELLEGIVRVAFEKVDLVKAECELFFPIEHILLEFLERERRDLCRHVLGVVQKVL